MNRARICLVTIGLVAAFTVTAEAASVTAYPFHASAEPVGVFGDFPTGFGVGSWKANGVAKSQFYVTPDALFGRSDVSIGEISQVTYYTKKPTTHTTSAPDWYLHIYTEPYTGSPGSTWYGNRVNSEPYFSGSLNDPANTWNLWTTADADNRLRWFDSSSGYFGAYTDPFFDVFQGQTVLGKPGSTYGDEEVKYFSVATGSAWAAGFEGQVDGLEIALSDGSIGQVNFEPIPEPVTMAGLVMGAGCLAGYLRRRRR